jgi:hypothetical protein
VNRFQQLSISPDATTILGRTSASAHKTHRVVLPRFQRQYLFNEQLMVPAIAEVILIAKLVLFAPHQGRQCHPLGVFDLHLLQYARVAIFYPADHKLVEMIAFPPHRALQNPVQLR